MKEAMQQRDDRKIHTISSALEVLNAAADGSANEIREMIATDYKRLSRILADIKPEVKAVVGGLRQATLESVAKAKAKAAAATKEVARKVDQSAHENAWTYMGLTAAVSSLMGFLLGRKLMKRIEDGNVQ